MGLGSTAKKIQKVADIAEDLYKKVNELKTQLEDLRSTVDETNTRVDGMERELAEQRALIEHSPKNGALTRRLSWPRSLLTPTPTLLKRFRSNPMTAVPSRGGTGWFKP